MGSSTKIVEQSMRNDVFAYAKKKYATTPEYLWVKFPDYAVLRHEDNRKWYGLIMNIPYEKIDSKKSGYVDILNIKLDDILLRDLLIEQEGYYIGYHVSRGNWLSVVLDGTVDLEAVCHLIDTSYKVTASKEKKQELRPPKEWLIPANPRYYDIEHAFDKTDTIDWTQRAAIKKGDTVFIYVGAPVSAILYQCEVIETDIPYDYHTQELTIKKLMKIRFVRRYEPDHFTFQRLKDEYSIFAIRGARGVPDSLSRALKTEQPSAFCKCTEVE